MNYLSKYLIEEANAISYTANNLDVNQVNKALELLDKCSNSNSKLIVSGVGKSGIVARKIAATFSSVGLTAIYLNPLDALHGDIGIVNKGDLCILLSNSGETSELLEIIPHLKSRQTFCIGLTGNKNSSLSKICDVFLNTKIKKEICPLNLAPTASTTVSMAIGDALASAWMDRNNISSEEFAFNHPGGSLGRKLTITVSDVMIKRDRFVSLKEESSVIDVIYQMTLNGIGCCWIQKSSINFTFIGIITDGDLRRHMSDKLLQQLAEDVMTPGPKSIRPIALASEAVAVMNELEITNLFVTEKKSVVGIIHIHDCLRYVN